MFKRRRPADPPPRDTGLPDPSVVRVIRRPVLERLRNHGAASVRELLEARIEFWDVPLDRDEIELSLDSARRQMLVGPLADSRRPDGSSSPDVEWALTPAGEGELTGPGSVASRLASRLGAGVRTLVPLVAAFGVAGVVHGLDMDCLGRSAATTRGDRALA
jgi:hypothetical protein